MKTARVSPMTSVRVKTVRLWLLMCLTPTMLLRPPICMAQNTVWGNYHNMPQPEYKFKKY